MTLTWTEVATRIQRAQSALESGQYRITKGQSSPKMFHVWNGDPEQREAYVVRFEPNATGTCTCPDYAHREGPACKHTAMVVQSQWPTAFERWQQKVKDLCQPEQASSDVEDAVRHVVELQTQPTRQFVASLRDLADIKPAYMRRVLNDAFGLCGIGWGYRYEPASVHHRVFETTTRSGEIKTRHEAMITGLVFWYKVSVCA